MTDQSGGKCIKELAERYNNPVFFQNDPVLFPRHFFELFLKGKATLQDVEIAGIVASYLAWGRRELIIRDCRRAFDEMGWQPYDYVRKGLYKSEAQSLHRTIKWSDFARICSNLREYYSRCTTLEKADVTSIRERIFGQKADPRATNKKIHLFLRWMVRNDGIVDLGIWRETSPADLIIPMDVHVHRSALMLGITKRKSNDIITAVEITKYLSKLFPGDPCKGDYALFAHAVSNIKINR
ncbi:MAG: TIGR02757 family protein [Bacteroidales bacterium]|jgi:uncharacterized protein (TIGR02757 family)|nr:TIGR02757 family protein [Bacteroidales bacterium]MDD2426127.1 TIGR02757 family protein [Bacteroidales bacterium]MDD3988903.1 TIGR02757 family protein [Bacteroidales bacterium]MDD4638712.1 TIGR02757 family protein [Bacteroidales bacterium]